jgi:formate dehydrogenase subunit delta
VDVDKLVRMANQIAANLDYGPDKEKVAAAAADHLKRFWNSKMRAAVTEGHSKELLDLSPVAARAVEMLAAQKT